MLLISATLKISQLATRAVTLQQGEKSVLTYANELSDINSELDHYRPPDLELADMEYGLMDRVYKLLQGLQPEFEGFRSQLFDREHSLLFDNAVSQLLSDESQLQDMKGGGERSACIVTPLTLVAQKPNGHPTPNFCLER